MFPQRWRRNIDPQFISVLINCLNFITSVGTLGYGYGA